MGRYPRYSQIVKDTVWALGMIIAMIGAWYKLQGDLKLTQQSVGQLTKDTLTLQESVKDLSSESAEHTTDIKVLETQINILGGSK